MFRKFGLSAWLIVPALLAAVLSPGLARADLSPSVESEIIRRTNVERQKVGAPPLRANATMTGVAESYARLMAQFTAAQLSTMNAHTLDGQDAGDRLANAGYGGGGPFYAAENVAWDFPTADAAVQWWVHHPGHRENLLNPKVTEIGVGVFATPQGEIRYDQVFAGPPGATPSFRSSAGSIEGDGPHLEGVTKMSRFAAVLAVPAVAAGLAFLNAGAPADASQDVTVVDEPKKDIPEFSETYLVSFNATRVIVVEYQQQSFHGGLPVGSPITHTFDLQPLEKHFIGHEHASLDTTKFKIVSAHYKKD